jgi:hypothetical protein
MSNFIRRLRAAWLFCRFFPSTDLPANFWKDEDARALSNFLTSDAGIKMRRIWLEKVNSSAMRAIMEQNKSQYMSGVAWGIRAMVAEVDAHLQISPSSSDIDGLTERQLEGEFRSVNR